MIDPHANDITIAKSGLRQTVLATRDAMSPATRAADAAVCATALLAHPVALAAFDRAATIMSYMSFGTEIDTQALFDETLRRGKTLLLPRISRLSGGSPHLTLHRVASPSALVAGVWGIAEPAPTCPAVSFDEVEFALVPGVAFDRAGNRLGYGKGYYDRLLAMRVERTSAGTKPLVVAVAFDCQLVEQLPVSAHDQAIDLLITPTHRITFTT